MGEEFGTVIPDDSLAELEEMFDLFDKNKNGIIDLSDLESVFKSLGQNPTPEELSRLLKSLPEDKFKDECISKEQFIELMSLYMKENDGRDFDGEVFRVFDKNGDGKISKEELREVMLCLGENLSQDALDEMFDEADTNHDGQIDYEEFKAKVKIP